MWYITSAELKETPEEKVVVKDDAMERNDKAKEKITVKDENDVSSENESRNSFGRSSLIMGILAVLGCICFYVVGIPFALIGIIFSIIGILDGNGRKKAVVGLLLSIAMMVFGYMIWDTKTGDI